MIVSRPSQYKSFFVLRVILLVWLNMVGILSHPAQALTTEEVNTIAVYERISGSVVNITTMACDPEFFFCAVPSETGSGSGVILKEDGTIITSYHVIRKAENIQVTLADGRRLKAEVVSVAAHDDLAILRIQAGDKPLVPIALADSSRLSIGEKVLAVGNPFGLGQTLTSGTVSMIGRDIRDGDLVLRNLIQTDAPINPGNSGGALVNSHGELVGINTAIFSPTGSSVGIGFAIPVNQVKKVLPGSEVRNRQRFMGWLLAGLVVFWLFRKIYRAVV